MTSPASDRRDSLAIHTTDLGKRFGDRTALAGVDLEVPRGTAFGSSEPTAPARRRSSACCSASPSRRPAACASWATTSPTSAPRPLARVGAIIEEPRFHPHLSGRENLNIHAAARDRAAHGRIDGALERVGLGLARRRPREGYSLGMRQRLGVARCLLTDPELLILDEPLNGLDPAGILEFRGLIRELVDEGRTVLLSSHLLDEVEKTCDVAAIVDSGRVVAQGTIHELVRGGPRAIDIVCANPVEAVQLLAAVPGVSRTARPARAACA
jgi:ABC-2 type transport system ATP-binding protein